MNLEMLPFQAIAPSAGFFTYGEICDLGDLNPFMNSTIVVVALREGEAMSIPLQEKNILQAEEKEDPFHHIQARLLSRFRFFLQAVTDELSMVNVELEKNLEEINKLRGILPICSSC